MSKYNTKQRQTLLEYLCMHPDTKFTARALADALRDKNISQSAVYRNLSELEREGRVRRSMSHGSREACYTFVDSDHCRGRLHLSCRNCGQMFHLSDESAAQISNNILEQLGFNIDRSETVLYGVCSKCKD